MKEITINIHPPINNNCFINLLMKDNIESSIYMSTVTDLDIIKIANKLKNKTSKNFTNFLFPKILFILTNANKNC